MDWKPWNFTLYLSKICKKIKATGYSRKDKQKVGLLSILRSVKRCELSLFSKHSPAKNHLFSEWYFYMVVLSVEKNRDTLKLIKSNYYLLTYVSSIKYSLQNYSSSDYSCRTSQNVLSTIQSAEVSQFCVLLSTSTGLIFLHCNFTELTWTQAALHIALILKGSGLEPNAWPAEAHCPSVASLFASIKKEH